jgi:hypothetical protein
MSPERSIAGRALTRPNVARIARCVGIRVRPRQPTAVVITAVHAEREPDEQCKRGSPSSATVENGRLGSVDSVGRPHSSQFVKRPQDAVAVPKIPACPPPLCPPCPAHSPEPAHVAPYSCPSPTYSRQARTSASTAAQGFSHTSRTSRVLAINQGRPGNPRSKTSGSAPMKKSHAQSSQPQ